jgi:LacI family transcriptional regulator
LEKFKRAAFPIVLIDHYLRDLETDFVVTDNDGMAYQLTRALLERGHREIAFLASDQGFVSIEDRYTGYRRALSEASAVPARGHRGIFAPEHEPPYAVVKRMMRLPRRPTAFFCINNGIAGELLDILTDLGYTVPDQVEIATVDDDLFVQGLHVPMISAEQAGFEMGRQCADILVGRVTNPNLPVQQRFLPARMNLDTNTPMNTRRKQRKASRPKAAATNHK